MARAGTVIHTSAADFSLGTYAGWGTEVGAAGDVRLGYGGAEVLPGFSTTTAMPETRDAFGMAVWNGRLYVSGGGGGTGGGHDTVYHAPINADGKLGSWTISSNRLPALLAAHAMTAWNGRLYIAGGAVTGALNTVYHAAINTDGTVGPWAASSNSLPSPRGKPVMVAWNGYLYVAGGYDTSLGTAAVYYAPINPDGTVGAWTTSPNSLPAPRAGHQMSVWNGRLYVSGGGPGDSGLNTAATVFHANINPDGSVGPWMTSANPLPSPRGTHSMSVWNGRLYVAGGADNSCCGGYNTYQSTVFSAPINSDGTVGAWTNSAIRLPDPTTDGAAIAWGGRLYFAGGASATTQGAVATVYVASLNREGTAGPWTTEANALPDVRYGHGMPAWNGRLYVIGGFNGTTVSSMVYHAPVNPDGTVGTWTTSTNLLPTPLDYLPNASMAWNGRLYVVGGALDHSANIVSSAVYHVPINPDGTLGAWITSFLPEARQSHTSAVWNGRLYVTRGQPQGGGYASADYSAPINSDGSIGSWRTEANTIPTPLGGHAMAAWNGRLYISGGNYTGSNGDLSVVYSAPLNSDASVGAWVSETSLPIGVSGHTMGVWNGRLYVAGGGSGSTVVSSVYSAPINSNGSVGSWTTETNSLPEGRFVLAGALWNGRLYVSGGIKQGNAPQSTVYSMGIPFYSSTGTYFGPPMDLGAVQMVSSLTWTQSAGPSGSSVAVFVATAGAPGGPLSAWTQVSNGGALNLPARFLQYRIAMSPGGTLGSPARDQTPVIESVSVNTLSPAALSAGAVNQTSVTWTWTDPSDSELGFRLYGSLVSTGPYALIAGTTTIGPNQVSYAETGLLPNTTYFRYVSAVFPAGESPSQTASTLTRIESPTAIYFDEISSSAITASAYAPTPAFTGLERGLSGTNVAMSAGAGFNYAGWHSGNKWTTKAPMPTARGYLTGAVTGGKLYAVGGWNGANLTTNEEYDPAANAWNAKAAMPTARKGLAGAVMGGKLYAVGGDNGTTQGGYLAANEEYDPATDAWSRKAAMPTARYYLAGAVAGGKVYAAGGDNGVSSLSANEEYDPMANAWTPKAPMPTARNYLAGAVAGGKLYAVGGQGASILTTNEEFDPATNAWTPKAAMPTARVRLAGGVVGGKLYAVGGHPGAPPLATNEEYDPAANAWSARAPMPTARDSLAGAVVGGRLYAVGGYNAGPLTANEEYDPGVSAVFAGLSPNTQYSFKAKARNAAGAETGESVVFSTYTLAAQPIALAQTFTNVFQSSLTVSWTAGAGTNSGYLVQLATSSGFSGVQIWSSTTASASLTFTGLLDNARYHARAAAFNSPGALSPFTVLGSTVITGKALPLATSRAFSSGQAASLVIGQGDFTTGTFGTSISKLYNPARAGFDTSGNLWLVDRTNNRLLRFSAPLASGMNADLVIGQADFVGNVAGTAANRLNVPTDLNFDGNGSLWVADEYNHRVLRFSPPFSNNMSANLVLGQADFTGSAFATTGTGMYYPYGIALDSSGGLWIADSGNNRVLRFSPPFSNGMGADLVLGQNGFTTGVPALSQSGLDAPLSARLDAAGKLWVADGGNRRVVRFSPPFSNGMNADLVLGQPNFTANNLAVTQSGVQQTFDVEVDASSRVWVADYYNARALRFSPPFSNGMNAELVIGQPGFTSNLSTTAQTGLRAPTHGVSLDPSGNLWVVDNGNHRVLRFDSGVQADSIAPSSPTAVAASRVDAAQSLRVSWTAPGNDGTSGNLAAGSEFRIQWSTNDPPGISWSTAAAQVAIATGPLARGITVSTTIAGLPGDKTAYVKVWAKDEAGNWSLPSSTASAFVPAFSLETLDPSATVPADRYVSMAVDAQGGFHIAYYDDPGSGSRLKYLKRTGSSWGTPVLVDPIGAIGGASALGVDASGNPHICYVGNANDIKYARYDGVSWSTRTVDAGGNTTHYCSLALDAGGGPRIAWQKGSTCSDYRVQYARLNGGVWEIQTLNALGQEGGAPSLALDAAQNPHIAYQDNICFADPGDGVRYAKSDGAAWSVDTPLFARGDGGSWPQLALDGSGRPRLTHLYYGSGNYGLSYARRDGVWTTQLVDGLGYGNNNLALDGSGNPHIAYRGAAPADAVLYASFNGVSWSTRNVVAPGRIAGIAIDAAGDVHAAYTDGRLKIAHLAGLGLPPPMGGNAGGRAQAPIAFQASAVFQTSVTWSWTDNSINELGFAIYGSLVSTGPYSLVAGTAAIGPGQIFYTETSLSAGTTYYRYAVAVNAGGAVPSNMASAAPSAASPPAPTGFSGSVLGASSISWTWADVAGESGYRVTDLSGSNLSGDLAAGTTYWKEIGRTPNTSYSRRVLAFNAGGPSQPSNSAAKTTLAAVPAGLQAAAVAAQSADLSWDANLNPAGTPYELSLSTDGFAAHHSTPVAFASNYTASTASVSGLAADTPYSFRVRAKNSDGIAADFSALLSTRTPVLGPAGFAGFTLGPSSISWIWSGVSGALGYRVLDSSGNNLSGDLPAGATSWAETGRTPNTSYTCRALAFGLGGASQPSPSQAVLTPAAKPTGLLATAIASQTISLSWSVNGNPAGTPYELSFSSDGFLSHFSTPIAFGAGYAATTASVSGLSPGTSYSFRVRARDSGGLSSDFSPVLLAATAAPASDITAPLGSPSAPIDEGATTNVFSLTFAWTQGSAQDPESGIAGYHLQVGESPGASQAFDGDVGNSFSRTITAIADGRTYYARVCAKNGAGLCGAYSPSSDGITVDLTRPAAPSLASTSHPEQDVPRPAAAALMRPTAPGDASGIAGYYFIVDGLPATVPNNLTGTFSAGPDITASLMADGTWYFHVVAKDGAGNVGTQAAHYKFIVKTAVMKDQASDMSTADGTRVEIPAGAIASNTSILITPRSDPPPAAHDPALKATPVARDITLADGTRQLNKEVVVTLPYTAADAAGLDEKSLRLFFYDDTRKNWELVSNSSVDMAAKRVSGRVTHFTLFGILAFQKSGGLSLSNYPNPFSPLRGQTTKIRYTLLQDSPARLRIYDSLGSPVLDAGFAAGSAGGKAGPNEVAWDGRTGSGRMTEAGTYICVVDAEGVREKTRIVAK